MEPGDLQGVLRRLEPGGWVDRARGFASSLRHAGHEPGRLLVVGTPASEPWHLAAHLDQTARFGGVPALQPVLARWQVPAGAPPHLAVGSRGGAVLFALSAGDGLDAVAHDTLPLPPARLLRGAEALDTAGHVVSTSALPRAGRARRGTGLLRRSP